MDGHFRTRDELPFVVRLQPATLRKYCQDNVFTNAQAFGKEWVISHEDIRWWVENRKGQVGRPPKHDAA